MSIYIENNMVELLFSSANCLTEEDVIILGTSLLAIDHISLLFTEMLCVSREMKICR